MNNRSRKPNHAGISLVELMITIAILSILVAIAIPLYDGYIREGHLVSIRSTIGSMRTQIEDFRLDNGNYGATGNLADAGAIMSRYGWDPTSDLSAYTYTMAVSSNSYDVWGVFDANSAIWVRCDDRMSNCCDPDTPSATAATNACP